MRFTRPLRRSLDVTSELSVAAEWRHSKTFLLGSGFSFVEGPDDGEATVEVLRFGWQRLAATERSVLASRLQLSAGVNAFDATIDGDGEQKKDYVYVGDIARANVLALTARPGLVLNIGTGEGTSVNAIFAALAEATGNTVPAASGPPRPGDVRNFWFDISLARKELGWEPLVSFNEGIRRTVDSFRKAP